MGFHYTLGNNSSVTIYSISMLKLKIKVMKGPVTSVLIGATVFEPLPTPPKKGKPKE